MFSRKSTSTSYNSGQKQDMSQLGIFSLSNDNNDDINDVDLEAELAALVGGSNSKSKKRPNGPHLPVNPTDLDKMVKECLQDSSDDDVSSGEDDDLLAELKELQVEHSTKSDEVAVNQEAPTSQGTVTKTLLEERLKMYEIAESNAKSADDAAKTRRMSRGINTLKGLIKQVASGHQISEEDIPPVVLVATPTTKRVENILDNIETTVACELHPILIPESINIVPSKQHDSVSEPQSVTTFLADEQKEEEIVPEAPPVPPRALKHSISANEIFDSEPLSKIRPPESDVPVYVSNQSTLDILKNRQSEYKRAALIAKKQNDLATALNYVRILKQFDVIIKAAADGSTIDLSTIPESLTDNKIQINIGLSPPSNTNEERFQGSNDPESNQLEQSTHDALPLPSSSVQVDVNVDKPPTTVIESLNQRLLKFKESEESAKCENNASKVRRMGRIVKQYEDAIKLHKAGKPIPVADLPTPPGFPPIPVNMPLEDEPKPNITPKAPKIPPRPTPSPGSIGNTSSRSSTGSSGLVVSRSEKQLQSLLEKQKLFKTAALKAKQAGNMDLAREYLKSAKGFDPLIEASKSGLPVDLSSLPVLPAEKSSLQSTLQDNIVRLHDSIQGTDFEIYVKLLEDLQQQLQLCIKTRDHFKAIGDIANANRFEQLAVVTKKDFRLVQLASQSNLKVPKFHYETKPFSIVHCNTDLTDNDVEVNVVQGINFNVTNPKTVDTYVKIIFPYPTDTPQLYKTQVIYDTNNPTYNSINVFSIQRNNRTCKRQFNRSALKCEVWSKGSSCCPCFSGLFRSDTLVGTATVKLQPLEIKCTVHDAYDLLDGRRIVGGKLEIKIRLRDPILQKQVEQVQEKWLIIDS